MPPRPSHPSHPPPPAPALPPSRTIGRDLRTPSGLAVDSVSNTVYWTDSYGSSLSRCHLGDDGSTAPVDQIGAGLFGHRMHDGPLGLAIDPNTNTLMWSTKCGDKIRRADLDGANVQTVTTGDTGTWSATGPWGLALHLRPGCGWASRPPDARANSGGGFGDGVAYDPEGLGKVYYTSWGRVQCYELGTGQVSDVVRGLIDPVGLVLDWTDGDGRLFWTDAKAGKVQCCALDGSQLCDVVTGLDEPFGLTRGPTHLFWTDRRRGAIQSCCMRTGAVHDVLTGLCAPEGIGALTTSAPLSIQSAGGTGVRRRTGGPVREHAKGPPAAATQLATAGAAGAVPKAVYKSKKAKTKVTVNVEPTRREKMPNVRDIMRISATALAEIQEQQRGRTVTREGI